MKKKLIEVALPQEGTVNRRGARCIVCDAPVPFDHVRNEGKAGRMGRQLMAIVAEGERGRVYLPPTREHEAIAAQAEPKDVPETDLPEQALGFRVQLYGMTKHRDLFTPRQLVALTTFSDLVGEVREQVLADACKAGMSDDGKGLNDGGTGATAYADTVATYLAFGLDKNTLTNCTQATWQTDPDRLTQAFSRQALPMTWDYAEANPLSEAGGGYVLTLQSLAEVMARLPSTGLQGSAKQSDVTAINGVTLLISTDPPYYDNIGYADLSDFFYVWLRRSLGKVYPDLFSTLLVPKAQELVATPYRFGGDKEKARKFFEEGSGKAFAYLHEVQHPGYPLTVYYAFKQSETDEKNGGDESSVDPPLPNLPPQGGKEQKENARTVSLSPRGRGLGRGGVTVPAQSVGSPLTLSLSHRGRENLDSRADEHSQSQGTEKKLDRR